MAIRYPQTMKIPALACARRRHLRLIHLVVGILGFLAFLGSGQYMDLAHDHLRNMPETPRLLFRSSHIYLLMIALLHLCLGAYVMPVAGRVARYAQAAGSVALIAALGLVLLSFFTESLQSGISRPHATQAIYLALAGVLLHVIASRVLSGSRRGA
jgi:hypothetical protein